MTEQQHQQYLEFIHTTLYEVLNIDDYYSVIDSLDIPRKGNRLKSACHNIDLSHADYNLAFVEKYRTFTCHSECQQSYSLLSLVEKRFKLIGEPKSNTQCMRYICDVCNIPFNFTDIELPKPMEYNWKKALGRYIDDDYVEEIDEPIVDNSILSSFEDKYYQGWIDEGISVDTMKKYGIRWYGFRKQIVIPAKNYKNEVIGIRVRNLNPIAKEKYMPLILLNKKSYSFPTGNYFFNEQFAFDRIKKYKKCYLVESEKTCMKMEEWIGEENTSLGLYGSNFTNEKLYKLLQLEPITVYICLDSDFKEIGDEEFIKFKEKTLKIAKMLKPYISYIYAIYNNCGFKDFYKCSITDGSKEQFKEMWNKKERIK